MGDGAGGLIDPNLAARARQRWGILALVVGQKAGMGGLPAAGSGSSWADFPQRDGDFNRGPGGVPVPAEG